MATANTGVRVFVRRVTVLIVGLALSVAGMLVTAGQANASATGCSWWGGGHIGGQYVPAGQYCFTISGSGTTVTGSTGSYNSPWGNVCNWSETVRFYDVAGNNYRTFNGPTHLGCWHANWESLPISGTAAAGRVCGTLKTNGARLTEVCHSIHP